MRVRKTESVLFSCFFIGVEKTVYSRPALKAAGKRTVGVYFAALCQRLYRKECTVLSIYGYTSRRSTNFVSSVMFKEGIHAKSCGEKEE